MDGKSEAFSGGRPSRFPGPRQAGPQASAFRSRNRDKTTKEEKGGNRVLRSSDPDKMQHRVDAGLSAAFPLGSFGTGATLYLDSGEGQ